MVLKIPATFTEEAVQADLQACRRVFIAPQAAKLAIEASPHLRHTLMWNGERTPVAEHLARELRDGDELYLLGPVAGG